MLGIAEKKSWWKVFGYTVYGLGALLVLLIVVTVGGEILLELTLELIGALLRVKLGEATLAEIFQCLRWMPVLAISAFLLLRKGPRDGRIESKGVWFLSLLLSLVYGTWLVLMEDYKIIPEDYGIGSVKIDILNCVSICMSVAWCLTWAIDVVRRQKTKSSDG